MGRIGVVFVVLVVALGLVPLPAAVADEPPPDLSLVFSVDGSGSISAADFRIEKDGIIAMLRNRGSVPLDGSVRVGIVQWGTSVRTELDLTTLDSRETLDDVIETVDGMRQLGGLTASGLGLQAAADLLADDDGVQRTVCMLLDGTRNTGPTLAAAVEYAQDAGVDRYTVAALQDGTGFQESTAISAYGPHVFGGGTVTFSRTAAEFTAALPGTCDPREIDVRAVEVNQGIQDWDNSVELVQDRPTVARVFAQTPDGSSAQVALRLRGYRNGQELPTSPLTAMNAGGVTTLSGDATANRQRPSGAANFFLPLSWRTGDVELVVDGGGNELDCAPTLDADCTVEVSFDAAFEPSMAIVPLGVPTGFLGLQTSWPEDEVLREQRRRLVASLPVANRTSDVPFRTRSRLSRTPQRSADWARVNEHLARLQAACSGDCPDYWFGVIDGEPPTVDGFRTFGAAADIPASTAGWWSDGGGAAGVYVGGHEAGHAFGRPHAGNAAADQCGDAAGTVEYDDVVTFGGGGHVALGPVGDPQTEPWGLDYLQRSNIAVLQPTSFIKSPHRTAELMSYCRRMPQGRWASVRTWRAILEDNRAIDPGPPSMPPGGTVYYVDTVVVSGITIDDRPELSPLTGSSRQLTDDDPDGEVLITVDYEDGTQHQVSVPSIEVEPDRDGPDELTEVGRFIATVPNGDIVRVRASTDEDDDELLASDHAPQVTIVSPTDGMVISAPTTVEIDVSDVDGDELTISLAYSPGDGTWQPVAVDLPADAELELDPATLQPSTDGLVRVVVSDGIRMATAQVEVAIEPSAPTVGIDAGSDASTPVMSGAQTLALFADTRSVEPISTHRWLRPNGTLLGMGPELLVTADQLPEGTSTLTLESTTVSGLTGSATLDVEVSRVATSTLPVITRLDRSVSGAEVSVEVEFVDDDAQSTHELRIDWGDGELLSRDLEGARETQAEHRYTTSGTYTINVCVDDGIAEGCASTTATVTVSAGPPVGPPTPPPVRPDGDIQPISRLCPDPPASPFTDVIDGQTHAAAIACLASDGVQVLQGRSDGTFGPAELVTRAQFASMLARALSYVEHPMPEDVVDFLDVVDDDVHAAAIRQLAALGVVRGFDDQTFRGDRIIGRGQMAAMLVRASALREVPIPREAASPFSDVEGTTHERAIADASAMELLRGFDDGAFRPEQGTNRAQTATMLVRWLGLVLASGDADDDDGGVDHSEDGGSG